MYRGGDETCTTCKLRVRNLVCFGALKSKCCINQVAPYTCAWIETLLSTILLSTLPSHLIRVRGLKQNNPAIVSIGQLSHLIRVRGLKPSKRPDNNSSLGSHLIRVRGLKQANTSILARFKVAPYTCAWIETVS